MEIHPTGNEIRILRDRLLTTTECEMLGCAFRDIGSDTFKIRRLVLAQIRHLPALYALFRKRRLA